MFAMDCSEKMSNCESLEVWQQSFWNVDIFRGKLSMRRYIYIHYVFVWRFFFNLDIYIYIVMSVTLYLFIHIPSINPARQTFSKRIGAMYKRWRSLQGALVLERPWALIHLQRSWWLQIMSRMSMIFTRVSFGGHAFCCCIVGNWCCIYIYMCNSNSQYHHYKFQKTSVLHVLNLFILSPR